MSDWLTWLYIYLSGCVAVALLVGFKFIVFWCISWLLKGNTLRKNLKKLELSEEETFWDKTLSLLLVGFFTIVLSWLGVLIELWLFAVHLLQIIRESVASVPEEIKVLRFPLHNNPNMTREAVWAHAQALQAKNGAFPNKHTLLNSLKDMSENHTSFDRIAALTQLKSLNSVDPDVTSEALNWLRPPDHEAG